MLGNVVLSGFLCGGGIPRVVNSLDFIKGFFMVFFIYAVKGGIVGIAIAHIVVLAIDAANGGGLF